MKPSELQKKHIADELIRIRSIRNPGWRDLALEELAQYVRDHPTKANKELLCLGAKSFAFDPWSLVRGRACLLVGEFGRAKDLPMLKRMMRDEDWVVRSDAVDEFEQMATDKQLSYLWKVLEVETHWLVRADIATYLAWRFGDSVLDRLVQLLGLEKSFLRRFGLLRAILTLRPELVIVEFVTGLGHDVCGIQCRTRLGLNEELERSDRMLAYVGAIREGVIKTKDSMRGFVRKEMVEVLEAYGIDPDECL